MGRWLSPDPIGEAGGLNLYGYVGNGPTMAWDPLGLDARFVIQRDAGRNSPGTMHAFENGAYLGSTRVNENGYIGKSNGIPCGRYLLLPRTNEVPGKSIYRNGTPAVTHPNYRHSPGKAGPGYRATVFVHGPSSDGSRDSKACITTDMHQEVEEVMDRNMSNGGTTLHNNIRRTTFRGKPVEWARPVRR